MRARVALAFATLATAMGCGDRITPVTMVTAASDSSTVAVTPSSATLQPGQSLQLTASAPGVSWTSSDSGIVRVSAAGLVTSVAPGTARVAASAARSRVGIAELTVTATSTTPAQPTAPATPGTSVLQAVMLSPAQVTLGTGSFYQFTVAGTWSDGSTAVPPVSYSATGGNISPQGMFTAGTTPGTYRVIAAEQGGPHADTSIVILTSTAPLLLQLMLAPATLTLASGTTQQFSVSATWSDGAAHTATVSYAATGGSITPAGLYTAGSVAGVYRVIATSQAGGPADTTVVQIPAPLPSPTTLPSETARSAFDFTNSVGVNVHLSYLNLVYGTGYTSIIKPRLIELGVRHLRDGGSVFSDASWMSLVYGRYAEIARLVGGKFDIVMSPSNNGTNYADASHIATLLSYAGTNTVESFEGLNEHDISGRAAYVAEIQSMQRALYATVKGDPTYASRYAVLGPSLVKGGSAALVGDLSAFMDFGVAHPYAGGKTPSSSVTVSALTWLRSMTGARGLQATESGYHTATQSSNTSHYAITERAMGKYVPRLFFENFNARIARTYTYELIDQGTDLTDMEQNFGLLRNDGSPKPAFTSLQRTLALLSDVAAGPPVALNYALVGDTTTVHHTLLSKSDGRIYLALWREVPSYDPATKTDLTIAPRALTLQLSLPARTVRTYEPSVSATASTQTTNQSQVSLLVSDQLLLVEIVP
jgi:hypothetical protein